MGLDLEKLFMSLVLGSAVILKEVHTFSGALFPQEIELDAAPFLVG